MILSQFSRKFNIVACLTAENLALGQQLNVLNRSQNHPQLKERDRLFWQVLANIWPSRRDSLVIVQPTTRVRWYRRAFKLYWRHKSRGAKSRRLRLAAEVKSLVLKLSSAFLGHLKYRFFRPVGRTVLFSGLRSANGVSSAISPRFWC